MSFSPNPQRAYLAASLIAIFFVCLVASCTPANAADVQDVYKTETVQIPHNQRVCEDVYHGGDKTADTLKGAILGGVLPVIQTQSLVPFAISVPSKSIKVAFSLILEGAALLAILIRAFLEYGDSCFSPGKCPPALKEMEVANVKKIINACFMFLL